MKKYSIMSLVAILGMCTLLHAPSSVKADESDEIRIADGVYIGTVNVGGMTEAEARQEIASYVDSIMETTFTLRGVEKSIDVTAEDMGVTCDPTKSVEEALAITHKGSPITRYKETVDLKMADHVLPLALEVDKQATARIIYKRHNRLSVPATNASLKKSGSTFTYVEGNDGEEVVEVDSVYRINDFLCNEFDGSDSEIKLVTQVLEAKGSEEELSHIKDVLGSFSTNYGSSAEGRKTNIQTACSHLNGTVLYPGDELSVHDIIAPLTVENGYAIGGAFQDGKVIESVGGGVCQVATTLYNAVIRSELKVTMRYNHSMIVGYVDPSDDAAIAGDYKDLRFENNLDYPIYIEGYADGSTLSFKIYGEETRPSNRKVDFESVTVSQEDPELQVKYDSAQPVGSYVVEQTAHIGIVAQLWKVVTVDGKEESRELFNKSTYKSSPKIVVIGTSGCSAEELTTIKNAAATKDEAEIQAAIDKIVSSKQPADTTTATAPETPANTTQN